MQYYRPLMGSSSSVFSLISAILLASRVAKIPCRLQSQITHGATVCCENKETRYENQNPYTGCYVFFGPLPASFCDDLSLLQRLLPSRFELLHGAKCPRV